MPHRHEPDADQTADDYWVETNSGVPFRVPRVIDPTARADAWERVVRAAKALDDDEREATAESPAADPRCQDHTGCPERARNQ